MSLLGLIQSVFKYRNILQKLTVAKNSLGDPYLAIIHLFKVINRNNRKMCKVCSKLTIKTSMTSLCCFYCYLWSYFTTFSSVSSIAEFEQVNFSWIGDSKQILRKFICLKISRPMLQWLSLLSNWNKEFHSVHRVSDHYASQNLRRWSPVKIWRNVRLSVNQSIRAIYLYIEKPLSFRKHYYFFPIYYYILFFKFALKSNTIVTKTVTWKK